MNDHQKWPVPGPDSHPEYLQQVWKLIGNHQPHRQNYIDPRYPDSRPCRLATLLPGNPCICPPCVNQEDSCCQTVDRLVEQLILATMFGKTGPQPSP